MNRSLLYKKYLRIAKQLNYSREFVSSNVIKVTIPGGFPYEAFDETGTKVTTWSLMQIIESTRAFSFLPKQTAANSTESFINSFELTSLNFFFNATTYLKVNRKLYEISSPKYPLIATLVLDYVGKSSINITSTIQHPEYAYPYATLHVQTVFVSPETRKPSTFPEWWKEKYEKNATQLGGLPLIMTPLAKSENVPDDCMTFKVFPSNTDLHQHTNWAAYTRFIVDAYSMLVAKNSFQCINGRSLENGVEELMISFRKESVLGDILTVALWEDNQMKNRLNVQVKKGETICSEATIKFYDSKDNAY